MNRNKSLVPHEASFQLDDISYEYALTFPSSRHDRDNKNLF